MEEGSDDGSYVEEDVDYLNDGVSHMSLDDVSAFRSVAPGTDFATALNTARNARSIHFSGDTKPAATRKKGEAPVGMPYVMDVWKDVQTRKRCSLTFHCPAGMLPSGRVSSDNKHFITKLPVYETMTSPELSFDFLFQREQYQDPSKASELANVLDSHPKVIARRTSASRLRGRNPDSNAVAFEQRIPIPFNVRHALVSREEDHIFYGQEFVEHTDGSKFWHVELIAEQLDSYSIRTPGFGKRGTTVKSVRKEDEFSGPATSSNFNWNQRSPLQSPTSFASTARQSTFTTPTQTTKRSSTSGYTSVSGSSRVGSVISVPSVSPAKKSVASRSPSDSTWNSRWGEDDVSMGGVTEGGAENPILCDESTVGGSTVGGSVAFAMNSTSKKLERVLEDESLNGHSRNHHDSLDLQSVSSRRSNASRRSHVSLRSQRSSRSSTSRRSTNSSSSHRSTNSSSSRGGQSQKIGSRSGHSGNASNDQPTQLQINTSAAATAAATAARLTNNLAISPSVNELIISPSSSASGSKRSPRRSPRNNNKYARTDD